MSMGKMLFAGGLIAALGGILYFALTARTARDEGEFIGAAFGNPGPGSMELNLTVTLLMTHKDGPKPHELPVNWDNWVKDHFDLVDASGTRIPLRRLNFSKLIPDQIAGTYDFFLTVTLKPGASYTCTVTPIRAEPQRKYQWKFAVPAQPSEPERAVFQPV